MNRPTSLRRCDTTACTSSRTAGMNVCLGYQAEKGDSRSLRDFFLAETLGGSYRTTQKRNPGQGKYQLTRLLNYPISQLPAAQAYPCRLFSTSTALSSCSSRSGAAFFSC